MKVQFDESIAGPHYSFKKGQFANVEEGEACRLCEKGIASPADPAAEKTFETYHAAQMNIAADKAAAEAAAKQAKQAARAAQAEAEAKVAAAKEAARAAKAEAAFKSQKAEMAKAPSLIKTVANVFSK